jgi:nucleoside-diphosphate-sugar epimerase
MIHAGARGRPYACFVRPDTQLPFMAMPDAVEALLALARAPKARLSRLVYNVRAFSPTANVFAAEVARVFPSADTSYLVDEKRQAIVDSWPSDLDDRPARADWGFDPAFDFASTFREYLLPRLKKQH